MSGWASVGGHLPVSHRMRAAVSAEVCAFSFWHRMACLATVSGVKEGTRSSGRCKAYTLQPVRSCEM